MMQLKPNPLIRIHQIASRGLSLLSINKRLSIFTLSLFGTSLPAFAATPSLSDAFEHCRKSYPTTFEAKKRLACFDSIEVKVVNVKPTDTMAEVEEKASDVLTESAAANEANPAIKKAIADELANRPNAKTALLPAQPPIDETAATKQLLVVEPVVQPSFWIVNGV